jgi:hypothetical protein
MDEKYPDHRTGDKDQDIYPERAVAGGPVTDAAPGGPERAVADAPLTGDARVDAAVSGLSRLAGTQPQEHVAILEETHGRLRDILGELAEGQR